MSFREKIHWVTLATMTLAFGWYFFTFPWSVAGGPVGMGATLGLLVPLVIGIILVMSIATAVFAIRSPGEVNLKEDERDRAIHVRGTHYAYYPLVVGVWLIIFGHFYGLGSAVLLNLLLATVVVAELIRIGSQLYYYRKGY